ncbi:hypothetical protein BJX96DRAFT_100703 [Aspergillus floccosus]
MAYVYMRSSFIIQALWLPLWIGAAQAYSSLHPRLQTVARLHLTALSFTWLSLDFKNSWVLYRVKDKVLFGLAFMSAISICIYRVCRYLVE